MSPRSPVRPTCRRPPANRPAEIPLDGSRPTWVAIGRAIFGKAFSLADLDDIASILTLLLPISGKTGQ